MAKLGIALLLAIVCFSLIVTVIYYNWQCEKDTVAWLYRAQVASNPEDMEEYLEHCLTGMEKWQGTTGHAAIIFKTPENDMQLISRALNRSIQRCRQVKEFDPKSVEYQTALDDLRGQIRELDLHMAYKWWISGPQILLPLLTVIFGVAALYWFYQE